MNDELFQWIIDTIQNIKGRLTGSVIKLQAETIAADFVRSYRIRIERGELEPGMVPRLPLYNDAWLYRFRLDRGLSWRMVNLRMKCGWKSLVIRLKLFFENLYTIRWAHYFLNGSKQILRFENDDEKPLWYTSASLEKSISLKGAKQVACNENVPHTRRRFTLKSRTQWPNRRKDNKHFALLLKGEGSKLREELVHALPDGVLLQFGPFGSYRSDTNVAFYDWVVPFAWGPEDETLYISDYFKCNVDNKELDDLIFSRGHGHMNIPGSCTGHVQVPDYKLHFILSKRYKRREVIEALNQLRGGAVMPASSHEVVLERSGAAWHDIDHDALSSSFVELGIAADLHGAEDKYMASHLLPIWNFTKMSDKRREIGENIRLKVESGELKHWHDVWKLGLIKPYPGKVETEGMEAFSWEVAEHEGAPVDDADEQEDNSEDEHELIDCEEAVTDVDEPDLPHKDEPLGSIKQMEAFIAATDEFSNESAPSAAVNADVAVPDFVESISGSAAAAPVEAAPVEAAPGEAAPVEAAPAAAAPVEAAPSALPPGVEFARASKSFFDEKAAAMLAANRAAVEALKANGGDRAAEELLLHRISELEKRRFKSTSPGAHNTNKQQTKTEQINLITIDL